MLTLPDLPPSVEWLSDDASSRLRRMNPNLWSSPDKDCITCGDAGVFTAVGGEQAECRCHDQWLLHRFLLHCGVGLRYQRLCWADLDAQVPEKVLGMVTGYTEHAKDYANSGVGLIMRGPFGTGKSMLSTLLLKRLIELGFDGYFTQFNTMLDLYTAGWKSAEDREWFERRVHHAGVLVVDDIGKESKGRENITSPLFDQVIRTRVANERPTIITTNYTEEQLQSGYGSAVMSLLAESAFMLNVTGADFRKRSRARMLDEIDKGVSRPVTLGSSPS